MEGIEHKLDAAGNPEFFEDPEKIFFDRVLAQAQFIGHVTVGKTISDQRHYLFFARGEQDFSGCAHHPEARRLTNGVKQVTELLVGGEDFSAMHPLDAVAK